MASAQSPFASLHLISRRRRAVALVLACAIPALIIFMFLRLAIFTTPPPAAAPRPPMMFDLAPDPEPTRTPVKAAPTGGGAPDRPATAPVVRKTPSAPPLIAPSPIPTPAPPLDIIPLTREDFAAADIAAMPRQGPPAPGGGGSGIAGSGTGRGSSQGAGTGPGGEPLYKAEWVREPTHAELAFYLPRGAPEGAWAEIACHTLPGFRVDQCQELGQSPAGLGLGGAIRQAAWQFRVRPPRVGGKTLVGSWVRIRISFNGGEG
ncbi:hypothetical protein ACFSGX_14830 [Sphingomonas arantia]|uniref:Protein TonB n=1 Tax=Sphingomonas arantia TaxID=1460676 RepID=A0ABW4U477_9SPHN